MLNRKKLEDYDFLLNLIINNSAKAVYQPSTKLNYRVFETGSISGRDSVRYHYEIYLDILEKYLDKLPHEVTGQFVITSWFWKRGWIACLNITMK